MDGGGIGKLDTAHVLGGVLYHPFIRKLNAYLGPIGGQKVDGTNKAHIAVGDRVLVLGLHHPVIYAEYPVTDLQFCRTGNTGVDLLPDNLVQLLGRCRPI